MGKVEYSGQDIYDHASRGGSEDEDGVVAAEQRREPVGFFFGFGFGASASGGTKRKPLDRCAKIQNM